MVQISGPPPGKLPCKPTLLLGIPDWTIEELSHVLINDLVYSSTSRYRNVEPVEESAKLEVLSYLDGTTLLQMTREFGGTMILSEDEVLDQATGEVDENKLTELNGYEYQAIVVDDTCFIREPHISHFVTKKYREEGVSVVIMALEGIFDLLPLRNAFDVDWKFAAYTKRTIRLTAAGEAIVGTATFPGKIKYIKANFVHGGQGEEMFIEHQYPGDYEDEEDYPDGPPPPAPGSPVVMKTEGNKSVSYFGFVNILDVNYGAIIIRLCYATPLPNSHIESTSSNQEQARSQHTSSRKKKITQNQNSRVEKSLNGAHAIIITILALLAYLYLLPEE